MKLNHFTSKKNMLIIIIMIISFNNLHAQGLKPSDVLYKEIAHADSVLFNAFNSRDINAFKNMFATDLEFFHDKGGLTDYNYTVESFKKTVEKNNDLRRDLVKGSLEVYPIKDYGAIQVASHIFCHTENSKSDCGTFKFLHIWKKINGEWKITRVVSYNH